MITSNINEIAAYLQHNDYSLAVRRTLDICLDTGDEQLIDAAINWSIAHNSYFNQTESAEMPATFFDTATSILQQVAATKKMNPHKNNHYYKQKK